MSANWNEVKARAQALREKYHVSEPPVNLFEIAAQEGIEIIYFKPDNSNKDVSGLLSKPEKEQEADCFAAELLMPKELIEKIKKKYGLSDADSAALSRLFGVSPAAMKYRLILSKQDRLLLSHFRAHYYLRPTPVH